MFSVDVFYPKVFDVRLMRLQYLVVWHDYSRLLAAILTTTPLPLLLEAKPDQTLSEHLFIDPTRHFAHLTYRWCYTFKKFTTIVIPVSSVTIPADESLV